MSEVKKSLSTELKAPPIYLAGIEGRTILMENQQKNCRTQTLLEHELHTLHCQECQTIVCESANDVIARLSTGPSVLHLQAYVMGHIILHTVAIPADCVCFSQCVINIMAALCIFTLFLMAET